MPTIKLGNFSKRVNSTKTPTATDLAAFTEYTVTYKKPTSLRSPVVEIATDVRTYDYAYISDFGRYYFVSDVISLHNGLTEYHLEADPMASQKTAIGNTSARIAFSSYGYNTMIKDPRLGIEVTKQLNGSSEASANFSDTGCYILTVYNTAPGPKSGFSTSYGMNLENIKKVANWLGANDGMGIASTVFEEITNFLGGTALSAIYSCIWVPFPYSGLASIGNAVNHIVIGDHSSTLETIPIDAYEINGAGALSFTATLAKDLRYTDFRKVEPYTTGCVYLPGIGDVDVNLSDWVNESNIYISYTMEYVTGSVSYIFFDSHGAIMQTASCNCASQMPVGGKITDVGQAVTSIQSMAGSVGGLMLSAATENALGAVSAAGGLLMGAGNAALALNRRPASISGAPGSRLVAIWPYIVYTEFSMDTEDPDSANYIAQKGRPVCQTGAISGYSGFVQCDDASVVGAMESWEREIINGYLNSGFFYE